MLPLSPKLFFFIFTFLCEVRLLILSEADFLNETFDFLRVVFFHVQVNQLLPLVMLKLFQHFNFFLDFFLFIFCVRNFSFKYLYSLALTQHDASFLKFVQFELRLPNFLSGQSYLPIAALRLI